LGAAFGARQIPLSEENGRADVLASEGDER